MQTKHGVIDWAEIVRIWNPDPFLPPTIELAELCAYGVDNGYSHLWILNDSPFFTPDVPFFEQARGLWDLKAATWHYRNAPAGTPNLLRSLYTYRLRSNPENAGKSFEGVNIIFCGKQAAWDWARDPSLSAAQCLRMIDFLQTALGVPVTGSPGNTGYTYLTLTEQKNKSWLERPTTDVFDRDFLMIPWEKAVHFLTWARLPGSEELTRRYLFKIDKNAAFPRAAVDGKQGVGKFRPVRGLDALALWEDPEFDVKTPGIWNIKVVQSESLFNVTFPPIKSGWMPTPMVRTALNMGYRLECEQAWLFEKSPHVFGGEYILRRAMNKLWAIRSAPERTEAERAALKQVMNDLIGLFHMGELGKSPKFRPDIYAGIVGGNYSIMLENMVKFADTLGLFPLLSHMDCIVYASDRPMHEVFPDNRESLGGYKHEWQIPLTDEVRAILTSGKGSAMLLQQLNAIAARQEAYAV